MASRDEVQRIKKAVEADFIRRPGITGIATGYKVVGGEVTDEISIRFYVAEKKDVPQKDRIPPTIEGIKTDVIQMKFVPHTFGVRVADLRAMADTGSYDPLRGGISIGPCRVIGGFVFVGTLGIIVTDRATGDHMALSNFHVMCVDNGWSVGDTMAQPSRVDGGSCPADVFGELQRAVLVGSTAGGGPGVDAAVASISGHGHQCSIVDIGNVAGTATAAEDMAVRKRGRTTGLTYGTVDTVDLTVNIDYGDGLGVVSLIDQIGIDVDTTQSTEFGLGGDSGSAVVNSSRRVVGLYYGGNQEEVDAAGNVVVAEGVYGVANPIQAVLDALNIDVCAGKTLKIEKPEKWEKIEKWEKPEFKEFKDQKFEKFEKPERKELYKIEKPEIREPKDFLEPKGVNEPKLIREPKDFLEPKGVSEPKGISEPKGVREPKDLLEPKNITEPKGVSEPKFDEPKFQEPGPLVDPLGAIEERLSRIERAVGQLTHFIGPEQRPDLSTGALKNEPDAGATRQAKAKKRKGR